MTTQKKLYQSNEEIVIDTNHDEKPTEADVPVKVTEQTNPAAPLGDPKLFENIKTIFSQEKLVVREDVYFTPHKGVFEFQLDGTIFMPSRATLLRPKKLEELYLKELESIIYNSKEQLDNEKLLPLIILFSHINKKNYPIRIVSGNYRKLLPTVCKTLNYFLNKNYTVIRSIYETFNSIVDSESENKQQPIGG